MVAIMMYVYFNRLFGDLPKSMFKKYHVYYLRLILILLTNFYIFPICTFSYKVSYSQSGKLQYKEIKDGQNVYTTEYVDSLRCYVTHAVIDDSDEKDIRYLEYNIIYDKYPDKIARIDTIKIVKRKSHFAHCLQDTSLCSGFPSLMLLPRLRPFARAVDVHDIGV